MANQAQYTAQPALECASVVISVNDTNRNSPAAPVLICTGPATAAGVGVGKRINKVTVVETGTASGGTTTANCVRFYIEPPIDEAGTNTARYLICEKLLAAVTPSSTVLGPRTEVPELVGLILPGSGVDGVARLWMTANAAATFHVTIESGLL